MLINNTQQSAARLSDKQFISIGIAVFGLVLGWEVVNHQGNWSWTVVPVLALAAYFIEKSVELPFISKPMRYHHGIFLAAFALFGPSNATLVAGCTLIVGLVRACLRCRGLVINKMLEYLPALLAIWFTGKLYLLTTAVDRLASLGDLLPAIFVVTTYHLVRTLLTVAFACMVRCGCFVDEWKEHYLIPTLVFFSVALGVGLLSHYALSIGNEIYLLTIPFALFVIMTFKIYSTDLAEISRRLSELSQLQMSTIETLALAIDAKNHSTHGHARRVRIYALGIARSLGIDGKDDLDALSTAALLHDIGKLAVPEYILSKPGKLSDSEFAKMMRQVEIGANTLEPIHFPTQVVPIIRYHHERYNGSGYPYGLKGSEIPLGSRILAIADTFDALTAQRTYRTPMTVPEAIDLIGSESGACFDPDIVRAFERVAKKLADEGLAMEIYRHSESARLTQSTPDGDQQHKLWLREKAFTEIASTHREIYALHEIFQTVGKSLNLQDTLHIICSKLESVIPFATGVVYLKNKKTDTVYPAMVIGEYAEQLNKNWIRIGEGLTGYAIAFNQQVVNSDPGLDFENLTYLERPHQLTNAMIFPLKARDSILGAIALYSTKREKETFTEDHVRLMETVSERAAVSIQNALSFEYYEENSLTDPLTGLPNSRYMFMAFEQNVKKAERTKEKMAVLVMDLNRFKEINDQYGHKVGDEVLIKVSEILQQEMRKYDTCIRYAGDEFVAFLYDAERETAEKIVDRIRKAVQALVLKVRSGKEVRLGISIGLSMYPEDGNELTQLFTVADSQMYNDKFESKAELARQAKASLQEAVEVDGEIEFQRAN